MAPAAPRELGDFQTPAPLARDLVAWLVDLGIEADLVVEPTCGTGTLLLAAAAAYPDARLVGFELQPDHVAAAAAATRSLGSRCRIEHADVFDGAWRTQLAASATAETRVLVLGNPPWVTTAAIGSARGTNTPVRSNAAGVDGWSARTGSANFDIAEWIIGELLASDRAAGDTVAMICKTAVARRLLERIERERLPVGSLHLAQIDAGAHFGAAVDACVAVFRFVGTAGAAPPTIIEHDSIGAPANAAAMGRRHGRTIRDTATFDRHAPAHFGDSPIRWRSGVKHDAARVLELTRVDGELRNGFGALVDIEPDHVFPLAKGADIAAGRTHTDRCILIPNRRVGEDPARLAIEAPRTWEYLTTHRAQFDARRSSIYRRQPPCTVFGVGEYAFQPYRIAISALHKRVDFRLFEPVDGRPVQFDDTVYAVGFDTRVAALEFLKCTHNSARLALLDSMVFWQDKRPIKARLLNMVRW